MVIVPHPVFPLTRGTDSSAVGVGVHTVNAP